MPLQIDSLAGKPDIARLIEDFSATIPLFRSAARSSRIVHPSTALLQLLGEAYLDTGPLDLSQVVQRAAGFPLIVDTFLVPVFSGSVRLSYFLMSLVLGRAGLREHFTRADGFDWTGCLRWLVLHGVREMSLWPFLSDGFVRELRAPALLVEGKRLSVLQAVAMAERPDVLDRFRTEPDPRRFAAFFTDWLLARGVADYEQVWLMSSAEVARKMREDASGAWTGAAPVEPPDAPLPGHDSFPDGPFDLPTPAALARAAGRAQYRQFGAGYPCAFLDMSDPAAAMSAVVAGEARAGLRGGLDLITPFIEIRLPDSRQTHAMLRLDLAIPERLREDLFIRIRVRDALGPSGFTRRYQPADLRKPLVIPLVLRQMALRLEISFALAGRGLPGLRDLGITFATLRSLHVWQVIAEDEGATLPATVAA